MKDYTTVRHAYRLAVIDEEGNTLTGLKMLDKLKQPIWDGVPFKAHIPTLVDLPLTHIKIDGIRQPNPKYDDAVVQNAQLKAQYLEALQKQYTWTRFVLQAYNPKLDWWTVDEPDNPQWMGFVLRTIGLTKSAAIKKLCKV
jgi:hypothetical protein